jgi:hypothetical protein
MSNDHKKNKSPKSHQIVNHLKQDELIRDTVRTEMEKQQANNLSELKEGVRDVVRKEVGAHQSRRQSSEAYAQRVYEADVKVSEFIQQAIMETTRASRVSIYLYIISYIAAFLALVTGATLILIKDEMPKFFILAMILIAGGAIWVISLQSHSPVKNSRQMVNHLAKLNVIFAGYVRQMHQMDAIFEGLYSSEKEIDLTMAGQMLSHLQDIMAEGMSAITQVTNDADE